MKIYGKNQCICYVESTIQDDFTYKVDTDTCVINLLTGEMCDAGKWGNCIRKIDIEISEV